MTDMIVSGTILICVILVLRRLTYGRISMGMRYALWLVVAVRMVLPVSFGSSSFSIMNAVQGISQYYVGAAGAEEILKNSVDENNGSNEMTAGAAVNAGNAKEALRDMSAGIESALTAAGSGVSGMMAGLAEAEADGAGMDVSGMAAGMAGAETDGTEMEANPADSPADRQGMQTWYGLGERFYAGFRMAVVMIWVSGVIAVGGFALFRQVRFIVYLHRTREKAQTESLPAVWSKRLADHGIQVWLVKGLPGPCMAGKGIYISP
ncbi:MAG: M56 family metallopeptidase, partial [Lachnospiraceae bacterium]|nr:M56 family metallopeptidase [Lachnospiraceae bacterium]